MRLIYLTLFIFVMHLGKCQQNHDAHNTDLVIENSIELQDDSMAIRLLIDLSDRHRYSGKYDLAFDNLREAQLLAVSTGNDLALVEIYRDVGILYDLYNKDSLAIDYLERALSLSKKLPLENEKVKDQIVSNYFSTATFWRDRKHYSQALAYLDSCHLVHNNNQVRPYALTDQGYCNMKLGNVNIAESQLNISHNCLMAKKSPYLAVNLAFSAELKQQIYQNDSALVFYLQSLHWIENHNVHMELKSDIQESIADIYIQKGQMNKAVSFLKMSKATNDKLFSTTSTHNKRLFEIKNKYKLKLEENKQTIAAQQSIIAQKDRRYIKALTLFAIIIGIGIVVYILFYQRSKYKRHSLINMHEMQKNEAVLEVKNKELTAYALKVVKMEENIDGLVDILKSKAPTEYKKYKNTHSNISKDTWDEFNQRFTEVNGKFYKILYKKHPDLTPAELKHCTLIKLNFSIHEISKILNISSRSVHTSRYRIKRKIGLGSDESLTSYIVEIE